MRKEVVGSPFLRRKIGGKFYRTTVLSPGLCRSGYPRGRGFRIGGYNRVYACLGFLFRAGNSLLISGPERTRRQENGPIWAKKYFHEKSFPGYTLSILQVFANLQFSVQPFLVLVNVMDQLNEPSPKVQHFTVLGSKKASATADAFFMSWPF